MAMAACRAADSRGSRSFGRAGVVTERRTKEEGALGLYRRLAIGNRCAANDHNEE